MSLLDAMEEFADSDSDVIEDHYWCELDDYEEDDSSYRIKNVKAKLMRTFDSIDEHSFGSFAASSTLTNTPNPGLFIQDVGLIGLPLSQPIAEAIARASHQAPFGQGTETVVDTAVRNTWELNPSQFELRNPDWLFFVNGLKADIGKGLGIANGALAMEIQLYKLLLYEEGAFFHKHRDSEKAEGMFATLVIVLPSEHEGGEVEATFGDRTTVLETASKSAFGCSWLAWYADVEHAVKPVTKGYRLVLTYNIIHTSVDDPIPSPAAIERDRASLGGALDSWNKELEMKAYGDSCIPTKLAYKLDHKYTDANLRLLHLKGKDRIKAMQLKQVCDAKGFVVVLANVKREVWGGCDTHEDEYSYTHRKNQAFHAIEDVVEDKFEMTLVVGEDGQRVAERLPLEIAEIIQPGVFTGDPDEEDYSGFTGNEGVNATHFYQKTCVVLLPRRFWVDLVFGAIKRKTDVSTWLVRLLSEYDHNPEPSRKTDIFRLCSLIVSEMIKGNRMSWGTDMTSTQLTELVLNAAVQLKDPELVKQTAALLEGSFSVDIFSRFITLLRCTPWTTLKPSLQIAFNILKDVQGRYDALSYFKSALPKEDTLETNVVDLAEDWISQQYPAIIRVKALSAKDADTAFEIASKLGEEFLVQIMLPEVRKYGNRPAFVMRFLNRLMPGGRKLFGGENGDNLFKDAIVDFAPKLEICEEMDRHKRLRLGRINYRTFASIKDGTGEYEMTSDLNAGELAQLIDTCHILGLVEISQNLLNKIQSAGELLGQSSFETFFMPFLSTLAKILRLRDVVIKSSYSEDTFSKLIRLYIRRFMESEPSPPRDWRRKEVWCSCTNCKMLNRFLRDPESAQWSFKGVGHLRTHLEKEISKIRPAAAHYRTIAGGSPYTLLVNKSSNGYNQKLQTWKLNRKQMENVIDTLGARTITDVFGVASASELFKLPEFASASGENARAPLAPIPQASNMPPTSGTAVQTPKPTVRKENTRSEPTIIDLT